MNSSLDELLVSVRLAAPGLLGWRLQRTLPDGTKLSGTIVETEAYHQDDPASHSFRGRTARTAVMFGPPGFLYVYFIYGNHWCMNVVCGPEDRGEAVLIRALEPIEGLETMRQNRTKLGAQPLPDKQLTNGPGKLTQALHVDNQLQGHNLQLEPLQLLPPLKPASPQQIVQATRIGISRATTEQARYYLKDNPYVSRA